MENMNNEDRNVEKREQIRKMLHSSINADKNLNVYFWFQALLAYWSQPRKI